MARTFAEYAQERRGRMGPEGREAERAFRAHYASLTHEDRRMRATENDDDPQD